jgi:hypothetical protein
MQSAALPRFLQNHGIPKQWKMIAVTAVRYSGLDFPPEGLCWRIYESSDLVIC